MALGPLRARGALAAVGGLLALAGCAGSGGTRQQADAHYRIATAQLQAAGGIQSEVNRRAAYPELMKAIALDPGNAEYHHLLGTLYFANRDYPMAEREVRAALKLRPDFGEARNSLGMIYADQGKLREAIAEYRAALRNLSYATPQYAYFNLASAAFRLGDYLEAADSYTRYLEIEPGNAEAHQSLGVSYARLGRLADAERAFTAALRIRPDSVRSSYELGMVLFKLGRKEEASAQFRRVVELDPRGELGEQSRVFLKLLR